MSLKSFTKDLNIPAKYPFPYRAERFTEKEKKILASFFTNCDKPVFAIYNLPQEVVGAMFSRYSRSEKSVRRLFLDEFWDPSFNVYKSDTEKLQKASKRTEDFYKRVFAEFGDDSVIQMGSVHVAFEYVSQMIAAKAIEDQRIGASYIEKSTRYVDFGSKIKDRFLYMDVPEIKNSRYYSKYRKWNDFAFEAYNRNLEITKDYLKEKYPLENQIYENPKTGLKVKFSEISDEVQKEIAAKAYERALKAKTFDVVRVFLPLTTVTNLGAHFSGQSVENAINKMLISPYSEVRILGYLAYEELIKVIPNFLQNISDRHGEVVRQYRKQLAENAKNLSNKFIKDIRKSNSKMDDNEVSLVDFDNDGDVKIASQILFAGQSKNYLPKSLIAKWASLKKNKSRLAEIISSVSEIRESDAYNRRHKTPRAFEHAFAEVEFFKDIGVYKDLQRNRLTSTERLFYNPKEIKIPPEFKDKKMTKVLSDYMKLWKMTRDLHHDLFNSKDENLVNSAEYVCFLGNKVRFSIRANIRQWVFFSELRTIPGGHTYYRNAMQKAVKEIVKKMPYLEKMFAKVDWTEDYHLGRLTAEIKTQQKLSSLGNEKMKIYLAGSIAGGREFAKNLKVISDILEEKGHVVLTKDNVVENNDKKENKKLPTVRKFIFERDLKWLKECDLFIAETSTYSHGVGYEQRLAEEFGKPILILRDKSLSKISYSAFLDGTGYKKLSFSFYDNDNIKKVLEGFIKKYEKR